MLENCPPAFSLTTFKFAGRTATLLVLVTAKHCSDLTLLCIDNHHLFLKYFAAIFIPISGGKMDHWVIFLLRFTLSVIPNVNLCPVFYLKAFWGHAEPFRKKPDGSCVTSLLLQI